MRYIFIIQPVFILQRWQLIATRRTAALMLLTTHQQRAAFLKRNTSWRLANPWLCSLSGNKCWYCEVKTHRFPYDVDHFRPKLDITVSRIKLPTPNGYYWLAYDWENFRLACNRCNRPQKDGSILYGKANEFELEDELTRCLSITGIIKNEKPKLLDPCCEADTKLLAHHINGEVQPLSPIGTWDYLRAKYTIDTLGLNNFGVPEEKRKRWGDLLVMIKYADIKRSKSTINKIKRYMEYDHEYSSFFRSAIGSHRRKPWVEELF